MSHVVLTGSFPKGQYTLKVSVLKSDYPGNWTSDEHCAQFVRGYIKFAKKYLSAHGYIPTIQLVKGYTDELVGRFDWQPGEQQSMRIKIMADYLASLSPQKAVVQEAFYDRDRLSG